MNVLDLLSTIPYFQSTSPAELQALVDARPLKTVSCGAQVIAEGDAADWAYVLLDGRLRSTRTNTEGKEVTIGEIGRGEIFGETGLLLEKPRTANVYALRDSLLLQISRMDLLAIVRKQEESVLRFAKTTLERADPAYAHQQRVHSVLVFPLGAQVDAVAFGQQLAAALDPYQKAHLIAPAPEEDASVDVSAFHARMTALEDDGILVVLAARKGWDRWAEQAA